MRVVRSQAWLVLWINGLVAIAGCDHQVASSRHKRPRRNDPLQQLHSGATAPSPLAAQTFDGGDVLAGTAVRHTFQFRNAHAAPLHMATDDGVQSSCGCTRVDVAERTLSPGQTTGITVEVRTQGKHGRLEEYARVAWQLTGARPSTETCQYVVRANVLDAVVWEPHALHFTSDDQQQQTAKQVSCTSNLKLDFSRAVVTSTDFAVEPFALQPQANGHGLSFRVRCHPDEHDDASVAMLQLEVPYDATAVGQDVTARKADLTVYLDELKAIRIAPRRVMLRAESHSAPCRGCAILAGRGLSDDDSVRSIQCDTCQLEWSARRLGRQAIRIELSADAKTAGLPASQASAHNAQVHLASGTIVEFQICLPLVSKS